MKRTDVKDASAHFAGEGEWIVTHRTWIDYDPDGDIDLFLGSSAKGNYKGSS